MKDNISFKSYRHKFNFVSKYNDSIYSYIGKERTCDSINAIKDKDITKASFVVKDYFTLLESTHGEVKI